MSSALKKLNDYLNEHPLVGRCVSVRNHYERSGLCHSSDICGDGGVPGAGRYLEGVVVAVTSARWETVRVGYPAKYFGGGMPRYATIPMQHLRSPSACVSDGEIKAEIPQPHDRTTSRVAEWVEQHGIQTGLNITPVTQQEK